MQALPVAVQKHIIDLVAATDPQDVARLAGVSRGGISALARARVWEDIRLSTPRQVEVYVGSRRNRGARRITIEPTRRPSATAPSSPAGTWPSSQVPRTSQTIPRSSQPLPRSSQVMTPGRRGTRRGDAPPSDNLQGDDISQLLDTVGYSLEFLALKSLGGAIFGRRSLTFASTLSALVELRVSGRGGDQAAGFNLHVLGSICGHLSELKRLTAVDLSAPSAALQGLPAPYFELEALEIARWAPKFEAKHLNWLMGSTAHAGSLKKLSWEWKQRGTKALRGIRYSCLAVTTLRLTTNYREVVEGVIPHFPSLETLVVSSSDTLPIRSDTLLLPSPASPASPTLRNLALMERPVELSAQLAFVRTSLVKSKELHAGPKEAKGAKLAFVKVTLPEELSKTEVRELARLVRACREMQTELKLVVN